MYITNLWHQVIINKICDQIKSLEESNDIEKNFLNKLKEINEKYKKNEEVIKSKIDKLEYELQVIIKKKYK